MACCPLIVSLLVMAYGLVCFHFNISLESNIILTIVIACKKNDCLNTVIPVCTVFVYAQQRAGEDGVLSIITLVTDDTI